jgi:hypothetical protein
MNVVRISCLYKIYSNDILSSVCVCLQVDCFSQIFWQRLYIRTCVYMFLSCAPCMLLFFCMVIIIIFLKLCKLSCHLLCCLLQSLVISFLFEAVLTPIALDGWSVARYTAGRSIDHCFEHVKLPSYPWDFSSNHIIEQGDNFICYISWYLSILTGYLFLP